MSKYFWKFVRNGNQSRKYISLIIDVPISLTDKDRRVWRVSYTGLQMLMILLHDVEVLNEELNETGGIQKQAFVDAVGEAGYLPSTSYKPLRYSNYLVLGQEQLGRHKGSPLDYGYYENDKDIIEIDVRSFFPVRWLYEEGEAKFPEKDNLKPYREYDEFEKGVIYFDFMPLHRHMSVIVDYMKKYNEHITEEFLDKILGWTQSRDILADFKTMTEVNK